MFYIYNSFVFICVSLAVVTKEIITKDDHPFSLFEDIIYQRLGDAPSFAGYKDSDILNKLYHAWSLIRQLVARNKTLSETEYEKVVEDILYTDVEYNITGISYYGLMSELNDLVSENRILFQSFFDMGADRYLEEMMDDTGKDMKSIMG